MAIFFGWFSLAIEKRIQLREAIVEEILNGIYTIYTQRNQDYQMLCRVSKAKSIYKFKSKNTENIRSNVFAWWWKLCRYTNTLEHNIFCYNKN